MNNILLTRLVFGLAWVSAAAVRVSDVGIPAVETAHQQERVAGDGAARAEGPVLVDTWLEAMCRAEGGKYVAGNFVRHMAPCVVRDDRDWNRTF